MLRYYVWNPFLRDSVQGQSVKNIWEVTEGERERDFVEIQSLTNNGNHI